ncbi:MAG: hypothetical protein GY858_08270 [Candidatus Omnitrophica bacterium]|nr:hypothetical protein [Candidatus Omnitrophota bacterium]
MKPHHSRYWLNPNHDNEEMFVSEVKHVCETYHEAPEKAATNNRRTISIDENTGIQALERKNPTKKIEPGQLFPDQNVTSRNSLISNYFNILRRGKTRSTQ